MSSHNPYFAILALKRARVARLQPTYRPDLLSGSPGARTFYQDTPAPFPAYPAPGAGEVTILTYRVPSAMSGVLTKLAIVHFGANPPDGTGNVVWRVKVNGAAEKGLHYIVAQLGSLSMPSDVAMIVHENDVVSVTVEVPAAQPPMGVGTSTGARVQGWLDVGGNSGVLPASRYAGPGTAGVTGAGSIDAGTGAPSAAAPAPASAPAYSGGSTAGGTGTSTGGGGGGRPGGGARPNMEGVQDDNA